MYDKLLKLAARPTLWQRSAEPFWDDVHISEMMLEAHLNPNMDAASRRPEFIEQSVKWLASVIPSRARVLDLGCGPGLYTKRLSDLGYDVTGVDLSKRSIAYARENDAKTKYVCQDYLTLDGDESYDAITLIYCDYAALTKPERISLLSKVRSLLKPDGLFIFDVFTPVFYNGKQESSSWYAGESGGFWSAEPHLCIEATHMYENNTVSADQCVVVTKDGVKEYIIWDTVYTKQSLTDELQSAGLRVKSMFSDVCGKDYSEQSETLCCIAAR